MGRTPFPRCGLCREEISWPASVGYSAALRTSRRVASRASHHICCHLQTDDHGQSCYFHRSPRPDCVRRLGCNLVWCHQSDLGRGQFGSDQGGSHGRVGIPFDPDARARTEPPTTTTARFAVIQARKDLFVIAISVTNITFLLKMSMPGRGFVSPTVRYPARFDASRANRILLVVSQILRMD